MSNNFWKWLYLNNQDKPKFDNPSDDELQFDPEGISPIIQNWLKFISLELYQAFPASIQQIIIYFVLHFEFQSNNPVIKTNVDLLKYEFSAYSIYSTFGTILFGKAFPSSTSVLFTYQCHVTINIKGHGIGIGIVPHHFNTFLFEHEYFPHNEPKTCVIFENGHFYGWNGKKQQSQFKIIESDTIIIEMNMKQKTMTLQSKQNKQSFVISNLPNDSRLAFVLDGAQITINSQSWKL